MHQLVYEQKPEEFRQDVDYSIKTLEDISGQKVKYFRAPGFSIRKTISGHLKFFLNWELKLIAPSFLVPGRTGALHLIKPLTINYSV